MKPEEIRRQRLRQWIDSDPASLGDVEAWCTHYSKFVDEGEATLSPTYIRQLVPKRGSAARNIGERTARRLERIGRKPRGWLDQEDSAETDMLYPAPDPAQPRGTAEALSDSYAKALQLETLRRSVKAIAAAFGVSPADLVSDDPEVRREIDAALGLATGTQAITVDDEIEQEQLGQTPPGTVLPRARPTMEEETADYPAEVDPAWQEEDTPRQQPAHKDRRA